MHDENEEQVLKDQSAGKDPSDDRIGTTNRESACMRVWMQGKTVAKAKLTALVPTPKAVGLPSLLSAGLVTGCCKSCALDLELEHGGQHAVATRGVAISESRVAATKSGVWRANPAKITPAARISRCRGEFNLLVPYNVHALDAPRALYTTIQEYQSGTPTYPLLITWPFMGCDESRSWMEGGRSPVAGYWIQFFG
eukprot:4308731-Amphidinium_carterae.1